MKLYNTLTRQVEEIKPLKSPRVTVYTCGPTVYDYAHVGHWFTYVRMDTLIRALRAAGLQPEWVMNITDVGHLTSDADEGEDKLEKGARREGKTAWEIAGVYTADFLSGLKALDISTPDQLPKATGHIPEQIELIKRLEAKGYTYVIDDGVYYDTSKFEGYGAFASLDLDEQQAGARVTVNPQKHSPWDFALWKFSPTDMQRDMEWDSPWGKGFPGWHTECSAMSMKYLGETLDIHTGGIDHIPVHHTNEIAQSEAATGQRFANHWMHSNHILVKGEKISKSLGNSIRLQEIQEKGFSPQVLRLHILESHYRNQSTFSWESLEAASHRLKDYKAFAALQHQTVIYDEARHPLQPVELESVKPVIEEALLDDLKTPLVLSELSEISEQAILRNVDRNALPNLQKFLQFIDEITGLGLADEPDIAVSQKRLITEREIARQAQDWAKSDELRKQLAEQGIELRDTAHGAIWFRS